MSTKTFSSYTNELPDATDLEAAVKLVANDDGTVETVTIGALANRLADLGPIASTESLNATNLNVKNLTSTVTANKTATDKAISDISTELSTFKATKGAANGLAPLNDSAKIDESILPMSDLVRLLFISSFDEVGTVQQQSSINYSTDAGCSVVYNTSTNVLVLAVTVTNTTTYYSNWRDAALFGDMTSAGRRPVTGKLYVCTGEDYAYRWNGTDLERLSDLSELQDSIEGHSDAICNLTSRVEGDETTIATNTTNIATNTANIATLNTRVLELGNFATEDEAMNALADLSICANQQISVAHLNYTADNTTYSITMLQCLSFDYCRQIIFNRDKMKQRGIKFTDCNRTAIKSIENQQFMFGDRLEWYARENKYVLNQYGGGAFNHSYCQSIPIASSSNDGLMSKELVQRLEALENKINAMT